MRLKSFTAKSTKEAMEMVRAELGENAIIVATHEEKDSSGARQVHMTAAIENDSFGDEEKPNDDWLYQDDDNESMVIEEITENLLRHTVPDQVMEHLISCAAVLGMDEPRLALMSGIESLYKFNPLPTEPCLRPFMMIGMPGAGKTLATAKMAARSAMAGLKIAVITTDTERAGGVEQLEAFTKLMGIELLTAKDPTHLKELVLQTKTYDQVIIDTAATNPFNTEQVKILAKWIAAIDCEPIMVMPAYLHADEAGEIAQIFSAIGAKRLLVTRIDVARRLGSLLSAAYQGGLAFADVSGTARVADGLSPLTSKRLTQLLMPKADRVKMQEPQNQSHSHGKKAV